MQVPIQKAFELPSEGSHRARVFEVIHKGPTKTEHGMKDQLTVVWIICDQTDAGGDELLYKQNLTKKVHPTSHFYKLIRAMGFAVDFHAENGRSFDTDKLIDKELWLDIRHTKQGGQVFADVVGYSQKPVKRLVAVVINDAIGGTVEEGESR